MATECPRNGRGMATEWPRNDHGMATEWPRNGHGMATEWPRNGRGMATEWPRNGRGMATEWPRNDHGMAAEWPRNGHGMTTEWPRNGRGMATEWPRNGRGMAAEWPRNGHGMATEWPRNGHGMATEWPRNARGMGARKGSTESLCEPAAGACRAQAPAIDASPEDQDLVRAAEPSGEDQGLEGEAALEAGEIVRRGLQPLGGAEGQQKIGLVERGVRREALAFGREADAGQIHVRRDVAAARVAQPRVGCRVDRVREARGERPAGVRSGVQLTGLVTVVDDLQEAARQPPRGIHDPAFGGEVHLGAPGRFERRADARQVGRDRRRGRRSLHLGEGVRPQPHPNLPEPVGAHDDDVGRQGVEQLVGEGDAVDRRRQIRSARRQ